MKTLYIASGCNILVDQENDTASSLCAEREAINKIYLVPEPMHVVCGIGEYSQEVDVKKDDIIIVFYENSFKKKMVVVKNKDWANNLKDYNKRQQEAKEKWAKAQVQRNQDNTSCEN